MRKKLALVAMVLGLAMAGQGWAADEEAKEVSSKAVEKDGLSAVVTATKAAFPTDEGPRFTVTFKNVSRKPIAVLDLSWYWKWTIEFADVDKGGAWRVSPLIMFKRAAPVPQILQPDETVFAVVDLGRDPAALQYDWVGEHDRVDVMWKQLKPGKYRLTVEVKLEKGDPVPNAAYWTGPIKTEPVEITIAAEAGKRALVKPADLPMDAQGAAFAAEKFAEKFKWGTPTSVSAHGGEFWVTFETAAQETALKGTRTVIVDGATEKCAFQKRK